VQGPGRAEADLGPRAVTTTGNWLLLILASSRAALERFLTPRDLPQSVPLGVP